MKKIIAAGVVALSMGVAGSAFAEPVKIGMITTTSGGGAGLGIDVRDAFQLAIKQSGNAEVEVIVEDDAQKPELAVQIAVHDRPIKNTDALANPGALDQYRDLPELQTD